MRHQKSIEALQLFATGLANGAFAHFVQGKHFESMGFTKLGEKYKGHYAEEMGWVEKFIARINDLGGEVKIEDQKGRQIVKDPVEYVKADLKIQEQGLDVLYNCMAALFAFQSPFSKGVILADEVGLGKTIEAGIENYFSCRVAQGR